MAAAKTKSATAANGSGGYTPPAAQSISPTSPRLDRARERWVRIVEARTHAKDSHGRHGRLSSDDAQQFHDDEMAAIAELIDARREAREGSKSATAEGGAQ